MHVCECVCAHIYFFVYLQKQFGRYIAVGVPTVMSKSDQHYSWWKSGLQSTLCVGRSHSKLSAMIHFVELGGRKVGWSRCQSNGPGVEIVAVMKIYINHLLRRPFLSLLESSLIGLDSCEVVRCHWRDFSTLWNFEHCSVCGFYHVLTERSKGGGWDVKNYIFFPKLFKRGDLWSS